MATQKKYVSPGGHPVLMVGSIVAGTKSNAGRGVNSKVAKREGHVKVFHSNSNVIVEGRRLCGSNSTLLQGDGKAGFKNVGPEYGVRHFDVAHHFNGLLVLASNKGLYVYDQNKSKLLRWETGLRPTLRDIFHLDSIDGVLWAVGKRDIAYWDGKSWTRVHHPDNPTIGVERSTHVTGRHAKACLHRTDKDMPAEELN